MRPLTVCERGLALGILLLVTAVTYRGVLANGFVYDDAVTVVKNPAVRSLARAPEWFVSGYASSANRGGTNYRPVAVASYGFDYAIWGERAGGFHATNLAIHLAVVILVFLLARRLWEADLPALVAAAWMALHPINVQAVNYITARTSTLAALGVLAALACYDRWIAVRAGGFGTPSRWWIAGAMACELLALGAKESAAVLPLLVLVWDRARFGLSASWRSSLGRSAPLWGLLLAWLVLRGAVLGGGVPGPGGIHWTWLIQDVAFAAKIVNTGVVQSLWPTGLAVDYAWPLVLSPSDVAWAIAGTVAIAVAGWVLARVDRRMPWCVVWYGVSLLPVLALPLITRIALYQEHRAYLAEIGVAWLAGGAVAWVASRVPRGRWTRVAAVGGATALAAAAIWTDGDRTRAWGDTVSLWEDALEKYPDSGVARAERGTWLLNDGRIEDAEREFLAALKTMPNYVYPYLMLGVTYSKRGETERAIAAYRTALEFRPAFVEARIRLGLAYEDLGLADQALAEYDRAIRDDPWASPALVFSAMILEQRGRVDEALERLRRVAPDDPIYLEAQAAMERLRARQGTTRDSALPRAAS